ncbi:F-box only protein 7-like [Aphomia sociella]
MNFSLEESTTDKVPLLLEDILNRVKARSQPNVLLQKDVFFILIIVLMVENGFIPITEECECVDIMSYVELLSGTEAKFVMVGFPNTPLKLIMSPLGAMVLLNIVIGELNLATYSICLPISRYIVSLQASTIPMMFRDLRNLSFTFKNNMLVPVKSRILSHHGYPSASLVGLPEEVFYKIMLYLPVKDVTNISKTCNRLQMLVGNDSLWRDMFRRDFSEQQLDSNDWKALYIQTFITRRDENLRRARRNYIDNYGHYVDNYMWHII